MKLLVICGSTATGKTSLALEVEKLISSDLISCDSRQVYRYMDVGTGKDIPAGFTFKNEERLEIEPLQVGRYTNGMTSIWGYDLVNPNDDFSVRHYVEFGSKLILQLVNNKKLPIIVGGSGYYLKALLDPPETLMAPVNEQLRTELEMKSLPDLQTLLSDLNPTKADEMNESDWNNPRRLLRAIEVSSWEVKEPDWLVAWRVQIDKADIRMIGLQPPPLSLYHKKIKDRVYQRLQEGFETEVSMLQQLGYWESAKETLGYQQWNDYLEGKLGKDEAVANWIQAEIAYSKRQTTWFNRQSAIDWHDVSKEEVKNQLVKQIEEWYS